MLAPCKMQEVLTAGEKLTEAWTSRGALWGAAVDAGTLLHVRLNVRCSRRWKHVISVSSICEHAEASLTPCPPAPLRRAATAHCRAGTWRCLCPAMTAAILGSYERGFDSSTVLASGHVTGKPCTS